MNKTLLLSDKAEIDTKPELEIFADDVQCAHGATAGELEQDALFYLRTRGIPEASARRLLVQAFLNEVVEEIDDAGLRQPFLNAIARDLPHADVLLGKPLPADAARTFYRELGEGPFDPGRQLQWLIDSPERLLQYRKLAHEIGVHLRVNIEIDVGGHRGHVRDTDALDRILRTIEEDPEHLRFAGFMGYDPHISGFPSSWRERLLRDVLARYREFVGFARARHPGLFEGPLTFNGAGSKPFRLYEGDQTLNDLAAGSGVVMPTDFDMDLLESHAPALFIAAPVLKHRASLDIPVAPWLGPLMTTWNPNRQQSFFLYGGNWRARYASPPGLVANPIYGRSSNSEMVNASDRVDLAMDDHVFLRPTQSEAVMLQFGDLVCVREGRIVDRWPVLPEGAPATDA